MNISGRGLLLTFLLSLSFHLIHGQAGGPSEAKGYELILTKKSNAKKVIIKTGGRLKIIKQDAQEIEGKVIGIDINTIHFKKGSVLLSNIYSIENKNSIKRQVTGGALACVGGILILGGTLGSVADETEELIITGAILSASSIPFLIQKTYSSKRWTFTIE